jgi:predicted  nucleic acid-binding Zn-ribbon protein
MADVPGEAVPDEIDDWIEERAAATDTDPSEILSRAVTLYRLVEMHAEDVGEMPADDGGDETLDQLTDQIAAREEFETRLDRLADRLTAVDELEGRLDRLAAELSNGRPTAEDVDQLTAELSTVDERLTALEGDVDEKIADVRERVIQVKRESDQSVDSLSERLDDVESTVDDGFENFEAVLSRLADRAETFDEKLTRLAAVVVSLRRQAGSLEERVTRLDAAAELKREANRQGETKAKCGDCSGAVSLGLLTRPTCPHCEATFTDIEPTRRPFSAATLATGSVPALTAGPDGGEQDEQDERDTDVETGGEQNSVTELLEESGRV